MVAEALPPLDDTLEERLEAVAREHGFAAFGIARADAAPETAARLNQWLTEGRHGDMIWMESRAAQRGSPQGLWPEVRSVIALGMSYAPAQDPLALAGVPDRGRISVYAQGADYHDVVKRALEAEGVDIAFWRIALRPGKPMMHGRLGAMRVIGVPGNPASSYICSFLFAVPLIRALSGRADIHQIPEHAILGSDVAENDHRQDYLRARMTLTDGGPPVVTPVSQQDSSLLGNLSAAKALVLRPPHAPAATAGTPCIIFRLPS